MDPFADALLYILRIGVDAGLHRLREPLQRLYHREQLHTIVGRGRLTATKFRFLPVNTQQHTPASWPGVSTTGAICIDVDHVIPQGVNTEGGFRKPRATTLLKDRR